MTDHSPKELLHQVRSGISDGFRAEAFDALDEACKAGNLPDEWHDREAQTQAWEALEQATEKIERLEAEGGAAIERMQTARDTIETVQCAGTVADAHRMASIGLDLLSREPLPTTAMTDPFALAGNEILALKAELAEKDREIERLREIVQALPPGYGMIREVEAQRDEAVAEVERLRERRMDGDSHYCGLRGCSTEIGSACTVPYCPREGRRR